MNKNINGTIIENQKKREIERFEPIPLQLPLEQNAVFPSHKKEDSSKKDSTVTERGVWTIDL